MSRRRKRFDPRYSGKLSHEFWQRVHNIEDNVELYCWGCALQDLESRVIAALERAERRVPNPTKQGE